MQNLRFGLRMLLRQPGFAAVAILTLALGIGTNTAIFSVVHGVVLKPLNLPDAERVRQLGYSFRGLPAGTDDAQFRHFREHQSSFSQLSARTGASFTLLGEDGGQRLQGLHVSAGYFETLGVLPALGRPILEDDDTPGATPVVILADTVWRSRFGADPRLLGRDLILDGRRYRVIGIMPSGFDDLSGASLWTPLAAVAASIGQGTNYEMLGRLRADVAPAKAESEMLGLARRFRELHGRDWPEGLDFVMPPLREAVARNVRTPLLLLLGAIGFVLLIACANVANLMLARAAARTREMAIRAAVGASGRRLAGQILSEGLLVAAMGALLGLGIAAVGVDALLGMRGDALPRGAEVGIDPAAYAFALFLAAACGLIASLPAAWQAMRRGLTTPIKGGQGSLEIPPRRLPGIRSMLVGGQVALALVLLAGAGLLMQTFAGLSRVDPGFAPERVLAAQFWTSGTRHRSSSEMAAVHRALVERVATLPGVQGAAVVVGGLPLQQGGNVGVHLADGPDDALFSADYRSITPGYFDALGVGLRQGRDFAESDDHAGVPVAIVNQAFARTHFAGTDALGRRVVVDGDEREIVGVVGDVRSFLDSAAPPTVFLPVAQSSAALMTLFEGWFPSHLLVRSETAPALLVQAVREAMRETAAELPVGGIRAMHEVFAASIAAQRFHMSLMGAFAGLAMLLAGIGIYGVLAYTVGRRTRDIGIRLALGAARPKVLRQVLGQGMRPVMTGIGFGLLGAWYLSRFLTGLLFGVEPVDPPTFVAVAAVLTLVALLACLLPALRATRIDPQVALREH